MNIKALSIDTAGFFFTNRFPVFLAPIFLTYFLNQALKLPLGFEYYLMIALTTAGGYIYNMHTDREEDSINYVEKYRLFFPNAVLTKWTIGALFGSAFLIAMRSGWKFAIYGGIVNFLFSLYSRPFPFRWRGRPLRVKEIPFLKNIYCSACWSVALVLTPYVYLNATIGSLVPIAIVLSFGLTYFVELLWDLRDMAGDAKAGFRTTPLVIGEKNSVWILRFVHLLVCGLMLWGVRTNKLPFGFLVAILHLPIGFFFLEYYWRLHNKELASHLYIMYLAALLSSGILINMFLDLGV